jgi:NADPH-dependent 2,4-dienoyl-CoA reductase/sulfur reductase-like enzyme
LVVRTAEAFRKKSGIDVRLGHRAEAIDIAKSHVTGGGPDGKPFDLAYDRLLIATGAAPIVPRRPGFDRPEVAVVKTLEDAQAIKARLQSGSVKRAVIMGMGYIAMEMAEALRLREVAVTMVKPRAELLPWLDAELAATVRGELEGHQVELRTGFDVAGIEAGKGSGVALVDTGSASLAADLVIVAVGVQPNSRLAADAGLQLGPSRSIAVDRQMRTSNPAIYAAGDCADAFHVVTGQRAWIPLALRANRAGWAVADHVCGKEVSLQGISGTAVFKVFDLQVARTGLTLAEAAQAGFAPAGVTISSSSRAHSHPGGSSLQVHLVGDRRSGRLLGAQMVGREGAAHRINAPAVALHAAMTVEQFSQTDLAYAPPFGPAWDPLLVAANQLLKKMNEE